MKWHLTSEEKPPLGERVLGWFKCDECPPSECEICPVKERRWPHTGSHICMWCPPAVTNPEDPFWDFFKKEWGDTGSMFNPHWDCALTQGEPIYWTKIEEPN